MKGVWSMLIDNSICLSEWALTYCERVEDTKDVRNYIQDRFLAYYYYRVYGARILNDRRLKQLAREFVINPGGFGVKKEDMLFFELNRYSVWE